MKGNVLVTGVAGFIGSHLAERLISQDCRVTGLDNFDDYYSPDTKRQNIRAIEAHENFSLVEGDIRDQALLSRTITENHIDTIAHLAARAGVRPSITDPYIYQDVNVRGTLNLLEASRTHGIKKFVFTSSSSVYGLSGKSPFTEDTNVNYPLSPYAASKASAELFCRTYSHLYGLPIVIARPFTVYGPRQRPEMAIHHFINQIEKGEELTIHGDGNSGRDYTYVEDIVDGLMASLDYTADSFQIFNLGAGREIKLSYLVNVIEQILGKKARLKYAKMPAGEVPVTLADISKARKLLGYQPHVSIEQGVANFLAWYRENAS